MSNDNTLDWYLPTLAHGWDSKSRAIIAGADRLEALSDEDRAQSVAALSQRVRDLTGGLDDRWLVATAGLLVKQLLSRGFVLHYVVDSVQPEADLAERLAIMPGVFEAAGFIVTGPQLMAMELMQRADGHTGDVSMIPAYREEGHHVADMLIARCHEERRCSVYLNLDLDDDAPALPLDVALSQANKPGVIAVHRNQPPLPGSTAHVAFPPGVTVP